MELELIQLVSIFGLGFVLGLGHALDADHVVAVSTIVSETNSIKKSSILGLVWGVGHTITLMLIAIMVLFFKIEIAEKFALSAEFVVGALLVLLGFNVLWKMRQKRIHRHIHQHGDTKHVHFHSHKISAAHRHVHTSLLMGMVHGLAGSAALMLLVVATLSSVLEGVGFVLIFGIGSMVGMMLIGGLIGLSFIVSRKIKKINSALQYTTGFASILFGIFIMYQTGVGRGLFLS